MSGEAGKLGRVSISVKNMLEELRKLAKVNVRVKICQERLGN